MKGNIRHRHYFNTSMASFTAFMADAILTNPFDDASTLGGSHSKLTSDLRGGLSVICVTSNPFVKNLCRDWIWRFL